ncbi:hypothetical protein [Bacillus sp. P14.5]|uniref:hypothetical protein n=1 Tax=Bacillus sp. P14.5 TaxID=1983400 RepID=UPI000DEB9710|nr:hypothetical protein [Bacillus sp. P14.5]
MAKIRFERLKIDRVINGSGVFYGENLQYKWIKSSGKAEGLGNVKGNGNTLSSNSSLVFKEENQTGHST